MKKRGFTLVELLAALVVLALIALIIYPSIKQTLKKSKNTLYDDQVASIIDGAKNWVADHPYDIPKNNGDILTLSLCQLKMGMYVNQDISNPKTKKLFDCSAQITIEKKDQKYIYDVKLSGTHEEVKTTDLSYPNAKVIGNTLEYLKVNDYYDVSSLSLNDVTINASTNNYELKIDSGKLQDLSGYILEKGTYLITYELIDKNTNRKTTLYKTLIVGDDN